MCQKCKLLCQWIQSNKEKLVADKVWKQFYAHSYIYLFHLLRDVWYTFYFIELIKMSGFTLENILNSCSNQLIKIATKQLTDLSIANFRTVIANFIGWFDYMIRVFEVKSVWNVTNSVILFPLILFGFMSK